MSLFGGSNIRCASCICMCISDLSLKCLNDLSRYLLPLAVDEQEFKMGEELGLELRASESSCGHPCQEFLSRLPHGKGFGMQRDNYFF